MELVICFLYYKIPVCCSFCQMWVNHTVQTFCVRKIVLLCITCSNKWDSKCLNSYKISVSDKCSFFELSIHNIILKLCIMVSTKLLISTTVLNIDNDKKCFLSTGFPNDCVTLKTGVIAAKKISSAITAINCILIWTTVIWSFNSLFLLVVIVIFCVAL